MGGGLMYDDVAEFPSTYCLSPDYVQKFNSSKPSPKSKSNPPPPAGFNPTSPSPAPPSQKDTPSSSSQPSPNPEPFAFPQMFTNPAAFINSPDLGAFPVAAFFQNPANIPNLQKLFQNAANFQNSNASKFPNFPFAHSASSDPKSPSHRKPATFGEPYAFANAPMFSVDPISTCIKTQQPGPPDTAAEGAKQKASPSPSPKQSKTYSSPPRAATFPSSPRVAPAPSPSPYSPKPPSPKVSQPSSQKVVNIPVKSEGEGKCRVTKLSSDSAASKIQSFFKGYRVRQSEPLKHLRIISKGRTDLEALRKQLEDEDELATLKSNAGERKKRTEALMSVLLTLDTVQCADPTVRDIRKSVTRQVIALMDRLDSLAVEETDKPGSEEIKTSGEQLTSDETEVVTSEEEETREAKDKAAASTETVADEEKANVRSVVKEQVPNSGEAEKKECVAVDRGSANINVDDVKECEGDFVAEGKEMERGGEGGECQDNKRESNEKVVEGVEVPQGREDERLEVNEGGGADGVGKGDVRDGEGKLETQEKSEVESELVPTGEKEGEGEGEGEASGIEEKLNERDEEKGEQGSDPQNVKEVFPEDTKEQENGKLDGNPEGDKEVSKTVDLNEKEEAVKDATGDLLGELLENLMKRNQLLIAEIKKGEALRTEQARHAVEQEETIAALSKRVDTLEKVLVSVCKGRESQKAGPYYKGC